MSAPLRLVVVVLMSVAVAACGTPSRSVGSGAPTLNPAPSISDRPASASPTPVGTGSPSEPPIAAEPPPVALEQVASGLTSPINIVASPDGWLLVNERGGRVVAVDPETGRSEVALDISDRVRGDGEQGLLGLAFHPDWPRTARAFVHYTDLGGDTVLSELAAADDSSLPRLDAATERVLLRVDQPYANHNGGQLAFGADGHLYMALGDGGAGGDPHGNGQNRRTLLGTILRIDVRGSEGGAEPAPYEIPPDNPFADGEGGAPEVFLYGLRNPWRFSFDRATGLLWIADVGQAAVEEINRVDPNADAGANLGWAVMEGSRCFVDPACSSDGLLLPIAEYGRDLGCSVTGGYVYRGQAVPDLRGWYLFGDYCSGRLFGVPSDVRGVAAPRVLLETGAGVSTFGEDTAGELYLADINAGTIYRIVEGG